MQRTLFVYGSFAEGHVHFRKLVPYLANYRTATVSGTLYRLPSGLLVLANDGTQTISGQLVTLAQAEVLFALLDEFHGVHHADPDQGLCKRVELGAVLEDGSSETTSAYVINAFRIPRGAAIVEGGDWARSLTESPPLFARLTDRQKTYIQKLGATAGREIVPIDLTLYRELMHLGVVIDKGRRLALTPLGQEIYRLLT